MTRPHGRRAIAVSMSFIAVSLLGALGAHAQTQSWAVTSLGANCLGATGSAAAAGCEAAAMYFERSTLEAYRCTAQSVAPDQPGHLVCQRLKLPKLPPGAYAIALGQAPASGDLPPPQGSLTPAARFNRFRSGGSGPANGSPSSVGWAGSYWIAGTDKRDIKFCLNFHDTGLDHEACSAAAIWQ